MSLNRPIKNQLFLFGAYLLNDVKKQLSLVHCNNDRTHEAIIIYKEALFSPISIGPTLKACLKRIPEKELKAELSVYRF